MLLNHHTIIAGVTPRSPRGAPRVEGGGHRATRASSPPWRLTSSPRAPRWGQGSDFRHCDGHPTAWRTDAAAVATTSSALSRSARISCTSSTPTVRSSSHASSPQAHQSRPATFEVRPIASPTRVIDTGAVALGGERSPCALSRASSHRDAVPMVTMHRERDRQPAPVERSRDASGHSCVGAPLAALERDQRHVFERDHAGRAPLVRPADGIDGGAGIVRPTGVPDPHRNPSREQRQHGAWVEHAQTQARQLEGFAIAQGRHGVRLVDAPPMGAARVRAIEKRPDSTARFPRRGPLEESARARERFDEPVRDGANARRGAEVFVRQHPELRSHRVDRAA